MWSILVTCVLTCCGSGEDANIALPSDALVSELKQGLQTGSLIFSQGDCLAVKVFSQSSYTHVGGVVEQGGEFVVYDSMNGVGVRKIPLDEYLRRQTPSTIFVVHPTVPFSAETQGTFVQHLESQLGRTYAVRHHLTGQRCEGLHCSEYMTDALMAIDLITAKQPPRVSPGSLLEGVTTANVYTKGIRCELKTPEPPQPEDRTWCQRTWDNTALCCSKSASQMRRWILCR